MRNNIVNSLTFDLISQGNIPQKFNFTESEANQLFDAYSQIIKVPKEESSEAWKQWAKIVSKLMRLILTVFLVDTSRTQPTQKSNGNCFFTSL